MKADKGICPHCDGEFIVKEYGFGSRCPKCKRKIDVFPDSEIFVETQFGTIGISGLNKAWASQLGS